MNIEEIKSSQAWKLLEQNKNNVLIDVRTIAEFNFVGIADLKTINQESVLLPWRNYPDMAIDSEFNKKLIEILEDKIPDHNNKEVKLLFMCRSGVRSLEAANSVSSLQYSCYNIINGFEGAVDKDNHRGNINGWKALELPWRQN